ncbi:MAG TPA: nucleotide exchange factor GrpE [Ktedonobacterales bacterium]|nr:nucleotide exchange factor GrpE [Ktedonobacterales bacterium]
MADDQSNAAEATPTPGATGDADRIAALERKVAELESGIERERDQATDYMRRWHTAQADFANYKRRAQQEQEQRDRLLAAQALAPTLNALDSLERAFMALPASLRGFTWIEGIALVELQLRRTLELQGIRVIETEPGQSFDPTRHEPIGEVETDEVAEGAIAVVAQRGYESQGMLIRPALVQLARKPAAKAAQEASAADTVRADATTPDATDDATETTART